MVKAILGFAKSNRAVYLESFGIVFPEIKTIKRSYLVKNSIAVRQEGILAINFEKCGELHALHREKFISLAETKELLAEIYPRLPIALQLRWRVEQLRDLVLKEIRDLKLEVVSRGYSKNFEDLGIFFSLHNRHGASPEDWFAGADIFLISKFERLTRFGEVGFFHRPQIKGPWDIFEAAYGASLGCFDLQVQDELRELGISLPNDSTLARLGLEVAVFRKPQLNDKRDTEVLVYCTNGLRSITRDGLLPAELIFQVEIPSDSTGKNNDSVPRWPGRALAMAAALRERKQDAKAASVATFGFPGGVSLTSGRRSALGGILIAPYHQSPLPHLTGNGEFTLISVVGVMADEVALAHSHSASHLLALLSRKGFSDITKPSRLSVLHRTTILPEEIPKIQGDSSLLSSTGWH